MTRPVIIEDYAQEWPLIYQQERETLLTALGSLAVAIEHVGSTAVPGLAAKPIIDIMVGINSLTDAPQCIPRLESLGYTYFPENEASIPERRYFDRIPAEGVSYHLHMVEVTSDFWERHLLFRDYLRRHPEEAAKYGELKKKLAERYRNDRVAYTEGKTAYIELAVAKAREEAFAE